MLDVSQAAELKMAFRRGGWSNKDIKALCEGDLARRLLGVIRKESKIVDNDHYVDLSTNPFVPEGYSVKEHVTGKSKWLLNGNMQLFLSPSQRSEGARGVKGDIIKRELEGKNLLNVNVLDYLLKNPWLIPESWKGKCVVFWGTTYTVMGIVGLKNTCVRFLFYDDSSKKWQWSSFFVSDKFKAHYFAAASL